jgi:hypothetical protein
LAVVAALAAGTYSRIELVRSAIPIALLAAIVAAADVTVALVFVLHLAANSQWETTTAIATYVLWGCLLSLAIQELVVRQRASAPGR